MALRAKNPRRRLQWTPRVRSSRKLPKTFFFNKSGLRIGYLVIKRVYSNIFVTLCDLKHRVIMSKSAGSARIGRTTTIKTSPHAMESILYSLKRYFSFYGIKQ